MKTKLLLFLLILLGIGGSTFAQGIRLDATTVQEMSATAIPGTTNVLTVPAAPIIKFCSFPANAVPCTNLATTFSSSTLGTPCNTSTQITLVGSTTCVASPDANGNFGFWAQAGQYAYTVTLPGGINLGPYNVTLGIPSGTNLPNITTGTFNGILVVDGINFANIAAAVTAAGSNPRIILIPSTYAGTECAGSPPATVYLWDFRALSGAPCGPNTDSYNGTTGGVQSFLRHSWTLGVPSVAKSYELTTNLASYSGSLPGAGNSLEGITSVAVITGTPTFAGTTLNLIGSESHAYTQSTGGLLPNAFGHVVSAGQQSGTTNITTAAGLFVQTNSNVGGGTIANNYGLFMQVQSGGTARNFSFFSQGAGLFSSDAGGSGINFEDSALVPHPILTSVSSSNEMRFRPLLDTAGFCFDNATSTAIWLCVKSTGVSIPTVPLIVGAGVTFGGGSTLTKYYQVAGAITPAATAANSCVEQTFTPAAFNGVVNAADNLTSLSATATMAANGVFPVAGSRLVANGIAITYCNTTAGALTAPAVTITVTGTR